VRLSTIDRHDPIERYLKRSARLEKQYRLRVMSPAEIVDLSIKVYQRMAAVFIRESLIPAFLALIGLAFVVEWTLPSLTETRSGSDFTAQIVEFCFNLVLGLAVGGPLILMGGGYLVATVVILSAEYLTGNPVDPKIARDHARNVWKQTIATSGLILFRSLSGILASVAVMAIGGWLSTLVGDRDGGVYAVAIIGIFGMVLGGIWFLSCMVRYALAIPVSVLENVPAKVALRRSAELQKGQSRLMSGATATWNLVGTVLLGALLIATGAGIAESVTGAGQWVNQISELLPFGPVWRLAGELLPSFIAVLLLLPAVACGITVIYFERRVRLEGFDIDALASHVSVSP
jgi:hypothetical protein